jgi:hypothetical protein
VSWLAAILLVGLGTALAAAVPAGETVAGVNARGVWIAVGLTLAAIVLLTAHQRCSTYVVISGLLALAAFPAGFVPYERVAPCSWGFHRPCMDRTTVAWHPGIRLAMFLVLLGAALVSAAIGFLRQRAQRPASRLSDADITRIKSLTEQGSG